jgi:hypothetical protein
MEAAQFRAVGIGLSHTVLTSNVSQIANRVINAIPIQIISNDSGNLTFVSPNTNPNPAFVLGLAPSTPYNFGNDAYLSEQQLFVPNISSVIEDQGIYDESVSAMVSNGIYV